MSRSVLLLPSSDSQGNRERVERCVETPAPRSGRVPVHHSVHQRETEFRQRLVEDPDRSWPHAVQRQQCCSTLAVEVLKELVAGSGQCPGCRRADLRERGGGAHTRMVASCRVDICRPAARIAPKVEHYPARSRALRLLPGSPWDRPCRGTPNRPSGHRGVRPASPRLRASAQCRQMSQPGELETSQPVRRAGTASRRLTAPRSAMRRAPST